MADVGTRRQRQAGGMTNSALLWPGHELTVENDGQYVHTDMPGPDPDWHFIDAKGHGHFYMRGAEDGYPTLEWVSLPCTMGHDEDCTSEGYYECRICAERIEPGSKMQPPVWVDGLVTYRLKVAGQNGITTYVFGPQQWEAVQQAIALAVSTTLADFVSEVTYGGG